MKTKLFLILLFISSITFSQTYVKHDATGANNGTSWADAYTNINTALAVVTSGDEIWVASGTYKPGGINQANHINVIASVELYGGFNGTETTLAQRDIMANPTVLSGDRLGNDSGVFGFANTTRSDNFNNVLIIYSSNVRVDGFTITGGHNPTRYGSGIFKEETVTDITIANCIISKNIAFGGAGIFARFNNPVSTTNSFTVTNTKFINNFSTLGAAIYSDMVTGITSNATMVTFNVANSLFESNRTEDYGTNLGYAGSAGWFRATHTNTSMHVNLTNNTYANNSELGTNTVVPGNPQRSTVGLSQDAGRLTSTVANCIFYNNKLPSNQTAPSISRYIW